MLITSRGGSEEGVPTIEGNGRRLGRRGTLQRSAPREHIPADLDILASGAQRELNKGGQEETSEVCR